MAKGAISIADGLKDVEKTPTRTGADTVRLWERYRDQALLWRALALLQIPTTFLAIGAALIMFFFADTVIQVPEKPEPGMYSVKQLPDAQFISAATRVVNSIATYQPETARIQFTDTRKMLWQPALGKFDEEMMQKEIQAIEEGRLDRTDNPLKNAPHTHAMVTSDSWNHKYAREQAAYPAQWVRARKFWPPVARVDNAYGDRNLVCECPPMTEY